MNYAQNQGLPATAGMMAGAIAPKSVEMSLLEGLQGTLQIAHDRVSRLEGIAARVFGEVPMVGNTEGPPGTLADNLHVSARGLVERITAVLERLERIA